MRYDDTLETVLASDLSTPYGKQSAWRQLVDLIGRRRIGADSRALAVLRAIQSEVPPAVRAGSARGLEYADPPPPLVRLLARDLASVAAPILRTARLSSGDWIQLLPELGPQGRAILRHRRDLSPLVLRALESFGPNDFALHDHREPEPIVEGAAVAVETRTDEARTESATSETTESEVDGSVAEPLAVGLGDESPAALEPVETAGALLAQEGEPHAGQDVETLDSADAATPDPTGTNGAADSRSLGSLRSWALPTTAALEPMFVRDKVRPFGEEATADTVAQPEPAIAPDAAGAPAEDLSYIALALGTAEGFVAATVRQDGVPAIDPDSAIQSETAATTVAGDAVAARATAAQGRDMLERSETLAAHSETSEPMAHGDAALIESAGDQEGPFQIADVVARIDAFWRNREQTARTPRAMPRADGFRFETDPEGVIRWVDGVSRNPMIGLSLELHGAAGVSRVDGVAAGAFRRRASFTNARLEIEGSSDAAGGWLISGVPVFEAANGRFTGYRGTARRPRTDERAEPLRPAAALAPDSLRQLVHELRTPTNAIAGFAEMIESEMLGPVPDGYRDRAAMIRGQARDLLGAIDDLDLAARIESAALSLAPAEVALRPLLATICDDLAQLTAIRGSWIALPIDNLTVRGDRRAVERLLSRLMATLVSASADGERIGVRLARDADAMVAVSIDRPRALADYPGESILGIDDEGDDVTLLGTGFALRLARNLARELGGGLVIEPESLTLRLPAAEQIGLEHAHLN